MVERAFPINDRRFGHFVFDNKIAKNPCLDMSEPPWFAKTLPAAKSIT